MSYLLLIDVTKARQADIIRQVERERMLAEVLRQSGRPPVLKSLVQALRRR